MCLQENCCADPRIGGKIVALSIFEQHGSFPKTSAEILARFRESLEQQIATTCQVTGMQFCQSALVYVLLKFSRHAYKAALQNQICPVWRGLKLWEALSCSPGNIEPAAKTFFLSGSCVVAALLCSARGGDVARNRQLSQYLSRKDWGSTVFGGDLHRCRARLRSGGSGYSEAIWSLTGRIEARLVVRKLTQMGLRYSYCYRRLC